MVSPIQDVYAVPATAPIEPLGESQGKADAKEQAGEVAGTAKEQAGAVAGTVKDQTGQVAGAAKEQAAVVAGTAKDQAAQVLGTVSDQAQSLLSETQQQVSTQASTQKDRAVTGLREMSEQLSNMSESGSGMAGQLVAEASQRAGGLASYLESREPGDLLEDLRDLGRRRTGGFLLGAVVLGFAGGRLLKGAKAEPETPAGYEPGAISE